MEFNVKTSAPEKQRSACLIIAVWQTRKLSISGDLLDRASGGFLSEILKSGDMDGRPGQSLMLHNVPGIPAERVLLAGCGKESEMNEQAFIKVLQGVASTLENSGARDACSYLTDLSIKERDTEWKIRHSVLQIWQSRYQFERLKSVTPNQKKALRKLTLNVPEQRHQAKAKLAVQQGVAIAKGMDLARDLGNLPGNICNPAYLAQQARKLGKEHGNLKIEVLNEADMRELKMGSLLSVSAGSRQPAKLIILQYSGGKPKQKPVVLVGKGVTFDSGGISLKPGIAMDEMKFDMCGAASVIGTINAVATMKLPINVVGIIPTTENMPDGLATRPGDIVTSMSGQTIEILNTDAEGRLILCDALTYAKKYNPRCVIDIATLTGACIIALGKVPSAVLGNDRALIDDLIQSGKQIEDKAWELPLWEEYQDQLKSNFADMANIGGRDAGTITAACFLSRFTKKYKWAHLDIAGTAWKSGDEKGATGRPVPLLTQFILNQL